jgi:hypothetical protein
MRRRPDADAVDRRTDSAAASAVTQPYPRPMAWEAVRAVVAVAMPGLGGYHVLRRRALAARRYCLSVPATGYACIGAVLAVGAKQFVLLVAKPEFCMYR